MSLYPPESVSPGFAPQPVDPPEPLEPRWELRRIGSPDAHHYAYEVDELRGVDRETVAQLYVRSTPEGERYARLLAGALQLQQAADRVLCSTDEDCFLDLQEAVEAVDP